MSTIETIEVIAVILLIIIFSWRYSLKHPSPPSENYSSNHEDREVADVRPAQVLCCSHCNGNHSSDDCQWYKSAIGDYVSKQQAALQPPYK